MIGEGEHPEGTSLLGEDRALLLLKARQRGGQLERADHEPEPVEVVLVRPPHQLPDRGADTVRADDQVEPLRRQLPGERVLQRHRGTVGVLHDRRRGGREPDLGVLGEGVEGGSFDVAAQHHPRPAGDVLESEPGLAVARAVDQVGVRPGGDPVEPDREPLGEQSESKPSHACLGTRGQVHLPATRMVSTQPLASAHELAQPAAHKPAQPNREHPLPEAG